MAPYTEPYIPMWRYCFRGIRSVFGWLFAPGTCRALNGAAFNAWCSYLYGRARRNCE